jgi:hypothetical protein
VDGTRTIIFCSKEQTIRKNMYTLLQTQSMRSNLCR